MIWVWFFKDWIALLFRMKEKKQNIRIDSNNSVDFIKSKENHMNLNYVITIQRNNLKTFQFWKVAKIEYGVLYPLAQIPLIPWFYTAGLRLYTRKKMTVALFRILPQIHWLSLLAREFLGLSFAFMILTNLENTRHIW